jgi:hypothetical protein
MCCSKDRQQRHTYIDSCVLTGGGWQTKMDAPGLWGRRSTVEGGAGGAPTRVLPGSKYSENSALTATTYIRFM